MRMVKRIAAMGAVAVLIAACGGAADESAPAPQPEPAPEASEEAAPEPEVDPLAELIAAAQAEGTVAVRSVFPEAVEIELFKSFEEEYGITVEYSRKGGSPPTLESWLTEQSAGQNLVDVMQLGTSVAAGAPMDLLADIDVPNEENIFEVFRESNPKLVTSVVNAIPLVYNTNLVDPADLPDTYEGLTDERWRGRMTFGTPENSFTVASFLYLAEQEYGVEWLTDFSNMDLLETEREVEAADLIARGERWFGPISQTSPAAQLAEGAPLGFHWPTGVNFFTYVAVIPEDAPHPNAARLFVNYLLSQEHQTRAVAQLRIYPPVSGVAGPEGFPDLVSLDPASVPVDTMIAERPRIVELWRGLAG